MKPLDMYSMRSDVPTDILQKHVGYLGRSLTMKWDTELMDIQKGLTQFVADEIYPGAVADGLYFDYGTQANEAALLLAREHNKSKDLVITSDISHTSIENACKILSLKNKTLPVDIRDMKVPATRLAECIKSNRDRVLAVVVTHGTTLFGSPEDIGFSDEIIDLCVQNNVHVHMDEAYGGMKLNLMEDFRSLWRESGMVDTTTIDLYKFISIFGGTLLMLHKEGLSDPIEKEVSYYPGNNTFFGTTKNAYYLKILDEQIKRFGIEGLKKLAGNLHDRALTFGEALQKSGFELLYPINSGVVTIKMPSEEIMHETQASLVNLGFHLSTVVLPQYDLFGLRVVVCNKEDTSEENLKKLLVAMEQARAV